MDLVSPGATDAGHGQARVLSRADPLFSGDGYLWLDTLRVGAEPIWERDNAAALLAGLEERIAGHGCGGRLRGCTDG